MAQELAPNFLKNEPYFITPWSVVYVDNGTCGVGKVLKVTGALGALRRKKVCVPMGREEASRSIAVPYSDPGSIRCTSKPPFSRCAIVAVGLHGNKKAPRWPAAPRSIVRRTGLISLPS